MADYTAIILLTLLTMLTYMIIYRKNAMIGSLLLAMEGLGSLILTQFGYMTQDKFYAITGFGIMLMIIGLLSLFYEIQSTFQPKNTPNTHKY